MRNTEARQAHLNAAERAAKHQIIEVAQVTDAEDAAGNLSESGPKREIVMLKDDGSKLNFVESVR